MSEPNVTAAHLACLRRIDRGETVGDLGNVLGALYLHDLVRDSTSTVELTDEGRALLAKHDAQEMVPEELVPCPFCHGYGCDPYGRLCDDCDGFASVPKVKPPRLVSLPLPKGWAIEPQGSAGHHHAALDFHVTQWEEAEVRALARAVLALADWLDHERAVKAQEVKP